MGGTVSENGAFRLFEGFSSLPALVVRRARVLFNVHTPVGKLQKELSSAHMRRLAQQHFIAGREGPHTDCDIQVLFAYTVGELKATFHVPDAFGGIRTVIHRAIEYGDKFISTESNGEFIIIKFPQKFSGKLNKDLVAYDVSETVVYPLEIIQVKNAEKEIRVPCAVALQILLQQWLECFPKKLWVMTSREDSL
nr:hypothetical protein [uncultured Desulfovibrio sp.]